MTTEEAIVTSKIYSVAGMKGSQIGLIRTRPFRAPHYSASLPAIIGGGAGADIRPGEVTLAENGILFLDEYGQMPKSVWRLSEARWRTGKSQSQDSAPNLNIPPPLCLSPHRIPARAATMAKETVAVALRAKG